MRPIALQNSKMRRRQICGVRVKMSTPAPLENFVGILKKSLQHNREPEWTSAALGSLVIEDDFSPYRRTDSGRDVDAFFGH
jgi:hypothetical protein